MAVARQLLPVVALLVGGCATDGGASPGSGGAGTGGGATTGGTSAVGGTSAAGGSDSSGGAPTTWSGGCETVSDPQSLPQVTLPHDECRGQPEVTPPAAPGDCLLWTGSGYLAAVSDARGIVVTSLDAEGATRSESILGTQTVDGLQTRLSRNGDAVLVVLDLGPEDVAAVAVVDLQGSPLSELSLLVGDDYPQRLDFAVTPSGDGWLLAFGYNRPSTGSRGILVSKVSKGADVSKQLDIKVGGYVSLNGFAAGENGDVVLTGTYDSGGAFSASYEIVLHLDQELEPVSCVEAEVD